MTKEYPIRCPLCDSMTNVCRFEINEYDLMACNVCDLKFINPYPWDDERRYDLVSHYSYDDLTVIDAQKHLRAEQIYCEETFSLIEQECRVATSVLDVGCGTGSLLKLIGRYPEIRRVGIELNSDRAEIARKNAGCQIVELPIERFPTDPQYDVILLINVLSHISNLKLLFNSMRMLLKKDGKIILKAGEMLPDIQKEDIFSWGIPDHVHFLGLNTVDFICRKYGFNINTRKRVPYSDDIFRRSNFRTPGRSSTRNMIKMVLAYTPFALYALKKIHKLTHGDKMYCSFIILQQAQ